MKRIILAVMIGLMTAALTISAGARSALLEVGTVTIINESEVSAEQRYKEIIDAARAQIDEKYHPDLSKKENQESQNEAETNDSFSPEYSFDGLEPEITSLRSWFGIMK